MIIAKISDIKKFQKPQDSIFSTLLTRKISRVFTFYLLKYWPKITPNLVSTLSFILSIIACLLFVNNNYLLRILGIIILQISFALDCSDGEIARIKNSSTKFGAVLDSLFDRIKEILLFLSISFFAYLQTENLNIILVAIINILIWLLIAFIRESKKAAWPKQRIAEFYLTKNIYIGTVDVIIYLICFAILLNLEYYAIYFFLISGALLLLKQLFGLKKYIKFN